MQDRQQHRQEVQTFLHKSFASQSWELSLPDGSGSETYFAYDNEHAYFVKLGVHAARYHAVASVGLTPPVLADGYLGDGTTIIVQSFIAGRKPRQRDYQNHLDQFATAIRLLHHNPQVRAVLSQATTIPYSVIGLESLAHLQQKWERYKPLVPQAVDFIDESLAYLRQQVMDFHGMGLVASHNDMCNANWLISPDGQLYLIDLDSMSLDDPAVDIGATLWWYYPPRLRERFLAITGYINDREFERRMRVRMAMHCLSITLPREQSFDRFDPAAFPESLTDFRAALAGKENPQGYND